MEQKTLSKWLKCILIGVGLCGLAVYAVIIPLLGQTIVGQNPEFAFCYWPWLCFLWATGIPCYVALFLAWNVASNIGQNRSFSDSNAKLFRWISGLAAGDAAFFFIGNIVMAFLNMNHPGILLLSWLFVFAGVAVAVAAAVLSHLIKKAAALQEQSDWTI
ncbi:MAG: DUF2975 domain-containing protein [Oscillospiraceae bacterium]|nr:DUF2975 domain-containing protein [Oscillospiraceae bacterium]